jgi:hypothetical protein
VDGDSLSDVLTDFPMLVELTPERVSYGAAGTDGSRVRFYGADESTLLAHEIERWVPGGTSHVWVKIPSLNSSVTTTLWMHAGASSPPAAPDPRDVWTAYTAVYHLADPLSDASPVVRDATHGGRDGVATGMTTAHEAEALFGPAYRFDGLAVDCPHVDLGGDDAFKVAPGQVKTVEAWFQRESTTSAGTPFSNEACCLGWATAFQISATLNRIRTQMGIGCCCLSACGGSAADYQYLYTPFSGSDLDWHHLAVVLDRQNDELRVFLDGAIASTGAMTPSTSDNWGDFKVGAQHAGHSGFGGILDEVRVTSAAASAAWLDMQHATTRGQRVTYGTPEPIP